MHPTHTTNTNTTGRVTCAAIAHIENVSHCVRCGLIVTLLSSWLVYINMISVAAELLRRPVERARLCNRDRQYS